jgi:hypothetical protein
MKKLFLLIAALLCFASLAGAQSSRPPGPRPVVSLPGTPCHERDFVQVRSTHKAYLCQNAAWAEVSAASGGGAAADVTGPGSSTDNAAARFDGTTGKLLQNGAVTISDAGLVAGATVSTPTASTQLANKSYVDNAVGIVSGAIPKLSGLASGGGVIWESAYTFRVSAATYYINGTLYTSAEQTITLTAAHATLDRIDVLALDSTGTLVKITGTAAAQPSEPDYDPSTQLKLTFVFVGASTTQPAGVSNESIYLENTEWTSSTSGSGWNANSTNNPRTGTKDIEGTTVANGAYVQLQRSSSTALDTFGTLSLFIRSKAAFNNNRTLRVQFFLSGVAKGNALTIADSFWGFDSSNTSSYQLIAIPVSQFAVPSGTLVNQLRIMDAGGSLGVYVDDVVLQALGTTIAPPAQTGVTQTQADARYAQRANNLSDLNSAATARTNLGGTTVGSNVFTASNPSAITFPKVAADNTVSFRTPAQVLSDIGALSATHSFTIWLPAAGCSNTTAASFWDLPTSTPAVAACVTGTNTQKGVLQFADTSGGFSAQNEYLLPNDWTGNIDAVIVWKTTATSGNAKFSLSTICTAINASETDDPSFNTASTVTTAAAGTANRLQTSSISSVTITGCAAREYLHLKLFRDGNDGSDTLGASLDVIGVELTIRRTPAQ